MTTGNLAIRLAVIDGNKVKATLSDVGESGQRALKRIEDAAHPASRALKVLDGAAGEVRGTLEGMTGRLGPLGSALSALGPAGLAAGAALAAVGVGLVRGVQEAAEAERSYRRLEAVLNATGHSAGLTGRQIVAFSEEMERSTLATSEAVQEAAAVLATFRSVSGETFTRTLALAQDMATVFGGDLSSAATQLGKALEDPEQGLTALRRVGISFTQSQRDVIQALMETGQQAEAQRLILDALEKQIGGAGVAEAGGLTGATNRLSDAWGNFLETLGQTPAITGFAQDALNAVSNAIETMTGLVQGARVTMSEGRLTLAPTDDFDARIAEQERRMAATQEQLAKPGAIGIRGASLRVRLDAQERELAELQRQRDEAMATARTEEERAAAGQKAAEAERLAERLAGLRAETEKEITQYATAAEKRGAIDQGYAQKRKHFEALRTAENAAEIDAALGREEELHRRRLASLEGAEVKRGAVHKRAAAVAVDTNARLIDQMTQQLGAVADQRQQFIDQALSRLSDKASTAQRAEVERLAGALYDQKKAIETKNDAEREGLRLTRQMQTPLEEYAATLARLKVLLDAGAISQETFNRAVAEANEDLASGQQWILRQSRKRDDGIRRALGDYVDEATNAARAAEEATIIAFQGMEDALTSMVVKGKLDFGSLADSIVADITRIAIKQAILAPLASAMFGGMSGTTGGTGGGGAQSTALGFGSALLGAWGGGGGGSGAAAAGAMPGGMYGAPPGAAPGAVAGAVASPGIGSAIGGFFSKILAAVFHEGGIVGQGAPPMRALDASVFLDAPRYHAGGMAYRGAPHRQPGTAYEHGMLTPDEIPAILQRGEMVLSRQQVAKRMGAGRAGAPVNVIMNITTPDVGGFRASQGQLAADAARTLTRVQRRNL